MEEVWRDVIRYEGLYQVSNLGRVKSLDKIVFRYKFGSYLLKGRILKQGVWHTAENPNYKLNIVALHKDGKSRTTKVHRMVARAFPEICGEWFEGCHVDHLDTNGLNNIATNLRVCTEKENHNNPLTKKHISEGKIGNTPWNKGKPGCFSEESRRKMSDSQKGKPIYENNPNAKPILQYSVNGEFIKEWACAKSAIEYYNLSQPSLSQHLHGRTKTCGGYIWKFVTK